MEAVLSTIPLGISWHLTTSSWQLNADECRNYTLSRQQTAMLTGLTSTYCKQTQVNWFTHSTLLSELITSLMNKAGYNANIVTRVVNQMTVVHQSSVLFLPFFAQRLSTFLVQKTLHTHEACFILCNAAWMQSSETRYNVNEQKA